MLTLFLHFVQTLTLPRAQDFTRRRKLPLAHLIVVLLSLTASGRATGIATKLVAFFTLARRSGLWPAEHSPHRSALTTARAKLPWQALDMWLRRLITLAYAVFPPREAYQWCGLSVFAFDGSLYALPATEAMRQAFDPRSGLASPGRGHYPQCLVMTAYAVLRRLPVGRTICPLQDGDERAQAQRLLSLLPPNRVSLFDRGFPSDGFLHALHQGAHR